MSIESMMPSNHRILCHPLLLPSIFPCISVFFNELTLWIRWPKYWSFSFSISPSNQPSIEGCFPLGLYKMEDFYRKEGGTKKSCTTEKWKPSDEASFQLAELWCFHWLDRKKVLFSHFSEVVAVSVWERKVPLFWLGSITDVLLVWGNRRVAGHKSSLCKPF